MVFLGLFHLSVLINNNGYYFVILMFHTFRPICKSVVHMFRFSHEAALTYAIATYIKKIYNNNNILIENLQLVLEVASEKLSTGVNASPTFTG